MGPNHLLIQLSGIIVVKYMGLIRQSKSCQCMYGVFKCALNRVFNRERYSYSGTKIFVEFSYVICYNFFIRDAYSSCPSSVQTSKWSLIVSYLFVILKSFNVPCHPAWKGRFTYVRLRFSLKIPWFYPWLSVNAIHGQV